MPKFLGRERGRESFGEGNTKTRKGESAKEEKEKKMRERKMILVDFLFPYFLFLLSSFLAFVSPFADNRNFRADIFFSLLSLRN